MKCPKCENDILENDKFCNNCGYDLTIKEEKYENNNNSLYTIIFIISGVILICSLIFKKLFLFFFMLPVVSVISSLASSKPKPSKINSCIFWGIVLLAIIFVYYISYRFDLFLRACE